MAKTPKPFVEKVICCDKCKRPLWNLKILAVIGDQPASSEWQALQPEMKKGGPKDFTCPLCSREFLFTHVKSGRKAMMLADPATGARKLDWLV